MKYLYDTNIFVYHLTNHSKVAHLFEKDFLTQNEVIISSVVRLELLSFPGISNEEERRIREMLQQFRCVGISEEIEEVAIYLRKKYKLKLPDAIISATAFLTSAVLVSANKKDFLKLSEIRFQNL